MELEHIHRLYKEEEKSKRRGGGGTAQSRPVKKGIAKRHENVATSLEDSVKVRIEIMVCMASHE